MDTRSSLEPYLCPFKLGPLLYRYEYRNHYKSSRTENLSPSTEDKLMDILTTQAPIVIACGLIVAGWVIWTIVVGIGILIAAGEDRR